MDFESVNDLVQQYRSKQIEMRCAHGAKNTKKSLSTSQIFCVSFEFPMILVNNSQYRLVICSNIDNVIITEIHYRDMIYRIHGLFGDDFNLAVWRITTESPNLNRAILKVIF